MISYAVKYRRSKNRDKLIRQFADFKQAKDYIKNYNGNHKNLFIEKKVKITNPFNILKKVS